MEDEAGAGCPFRIRLPERRRDQFGAGNSGYPVSDDLPREQVQNDGDVIVLAFQLVAGNIADPYLIWALCGEVLVENVFLWDGRHQPIMIFLRGRTHADQTHILHDGRHESLAHPLTSLDEDGADLVRTKYLVVFFVYLPDFLTDLRPPLGVPCIAPLIS